jgi:hypothetical protein
MAVHKVIDMIAMRYRLVTAVRAVNVSSLMPITVVVRRAVSRIAGADLNPVFLHPIAVGMMQVAIVKIISVAVVLDCRMTASLAMRMAVCTLVFPVKIAHCSFLSSSSLSAD